MSQMKITIMMTVFRESETSCEAMIQIMFFLAVSDIGELFCNSLTFGLLLMNVRALAKIYGLQLPPIFES